MNAMPTTNPRASLLTASFLRMLSISLEQLEAVQVAASRAEYAGLADLAQRLERETDQLEREMDAQCLDAFGHESDPYQLEFYLLVFRSLTNLERVGDYAFRVATDIERLAPRSHSATLQDVLPLTGLLARMLDLLAYAFAERDLAAARQVQRLDYEEVDALYVQMLRASLTRLQERPEDKDIALAANRIARHLERLGDHLGHVAARLERYLLLSHTADLRHGT